MTGLLVLQDMFDLTDSETLFRLKYDISYRWALDIQYATDDTLYVSPKTFYNFKQMVYTNKLDKLIFNDTTRNLMAKFKVDYTFQRMDSMHFNSNMKKLGRLGVMSATVVKFLKTLKKDDSEAFNTIDPILINTYLRKDGDGFNYFGHVKPSRRDSVMYDVAKDIFALINLFQSNSLVSMMPSFALLNRVFNDQCRVNYDEKIEAGSEIAIKHDDEVDSLTRACLEGIGITEEPVDEVRVSDLVTIPTVELLPAKEISSGALQNPSDPDAAYSGHKGQGYHVQIAETYTPTDSESVDLSLNLITYVKVEKANEPDSAALIPAVDDLEARNMKPEDFLLDTSYGSDANSEYAASKNVELVSPVPGNGTARSNSKQAANLSSTEKTIDKAQTESFASENTAWVETYADEASDTVLSSIRLADFESTKRGVVKGCPMGQKAETQRNNHNTGGRAYFDRAVCMKCPCCGLCPVTITKNKAWLTYQDELVRLDKRRVYQETNEFRDRYRWRSGIEATNSQLARIGAKRLRVRGMNSCRFSLTFKALALNSKRVIAYVSQKSKKSIHN
jgi:hypothetical protein